MCIDSGRMVAKTYVKPEQERTTLLNEMNDNIPQNAQNAPNAGLAVWSTTSWDRGQERARYVLLRHMGTLSVIVLASRREVG